MVNPWAGEVAVVVNDERRVAKSDGFDALRDTLQGLAAALGQTAVAA